MKIEVGESCGVECKAAAYEAKYRELAEQYKEMPAVERNGEKGQQLRKQMSAIQARLSGLLIGENINNTGNIMT